MSSSELNEAVLLELLLEGETGFVSGSALAGKLAMSRAAVWKHVERLRSYGYRIEAVASRGYRLLEVPDRMTSLELKPLLNTRELGQRIDFFEELESTSTEAFSLARSGAPHGTLVVAERQTAGRGRRGRSWLTIPGKQFLGSLVLRPQIPPTVAPEITLLTAVALCAALTDASVPRVAIKWPNDIHCDGRKLAGVLTDLSAEADLVHFVILGIGVNLNGTHIPQPIADIATTVESLTGVPVRRAVFAAALLSHLEEWLSRWTNDGFAPVRKAWLQHNSTVGSEVSFELNGLRREGQAVDLDPTGALLVQEGKELRRIVAGDVLEHRRG